MTQNWCELVLSLQCLQTTLGICSFMGAWHSHGEFSYLSITWIYLIYLGYIWVYLGITQTFMAWSLHTDSGLSSPKVMPWEQQFHKAAWLDRGIAHKYWRKLSAGCVKDCRMRRWMPALWDGSFLLKSLLVWTTAAGGLFSVEAVQLCTQEALGAVHSFILHLGFLLNFGMVHFPVCPVCVASEVRVTFLKCKTCSTFSGFTGSPCWILMLYVGYLKELTECNFF